MSIKVLLAKNLWREIVRKYGEPKRPGEMHQSALSRDTKDMVSQKTISNYLSPLNKSGAELANVSGANIDQLEHLAKVFGIEVWQLLTPDNDPETELITSYRSADQEGKNAILSTAKALARKS